MAEFFPRTSIYCKKVQWTSLELHKCKEGNGNK